MAICDLERVEILPGDIREIILKLLHIRSRTFRNAPQRYADDYVVYEGGDRDHATAFYPRHKLLRYPKKYNVSPQ